MHVLFSFEKSASYMHQLKYIFTNLQFELKKSKSAKNVIASIKDNIIINLNNKIISDCTHLDTSKTCKYVEHNILLDKFRIYLTSQLNLT